MLKNLIGKTIRTLTGRPNKVLGLEGDEVRVATTRSPKGTLVPIAWVQDALDRLATDGDIEISVESVGYRSAFVGATPSTRCSNLPVANYAAVGGHEDDVGVRGPRDTPYDLHNRLRLAARGLRWPARAEARA